MARQSCSTNKLSRHAYFSVHDDGDLVFQEQAREVGTRKLTALIRVEDLRLSVTSQRIFYDLKTIVSFKRNRQVQRQYLATAPINNRGKMDKAPHHRDVGDVNCPDLIGPIHDWVAKQIEIDFMARCRL